MKIKKVIATGASLALASTLVCSAPVQYQLLLSGPVEAVDRSANSVTVLGHQLVVRDVSAIFPGHRVNVFGGLENGFAKAAIIQDTNVYATSGDQVVITGTVRAIDSLRGRIVIDGLSVDYTALLFQSQFSLPTVGNSVRVLGTQPNGRGVVLAGAIAELWPAGVSGGGVPLGVSGGGVPAR